MQSGSHCFMLELRTKLVAHEVHSVEEPDPVQEVHGAIGVQVGPLGLGLGLGLGDLR